MNGGAIAYTGPALPNLMSDETKDLYGNDFSVSFQSASWIGMTRLLFVKLKLLYNKCS